MRVTVDVIAGHGPSGRSVKETLCVEEIAAGEFLVLASPGLVQGVAAGDRIRVDAAGNADVVFRGRNLCVRLFGGAEELAVIDGRIEPVLAALDARVDGVDRQLRVLTVPLKDDFKRVERWTGWWKVSRSNGTSATSTMRSTE